MKKAKEIIKLLLANKTVRRLRRNFSAFFYPLISSSYLLTIPVTFFNPFMFAREKRAVLSGKGVYYKNVSRTMSRNMIGLRRNTHRLEKALIMRPRRDVFAKDYILETVEWYKSVVQKIQKDKTRHDEGEVAWANNVLKEYFAVVKPGTPVIDEAKALFESVDFNPKQKDQKPFMRGESGDIPTFEQFLNLAEYRRSVRWFKDKKVDRSIIDKALLTAGQSPTACNRMPYEFRIFDDPELVKEVANIPFGTGGYADNIPVIGVLVGKLDSYFSARDRHAIYIDSSLAMMGFVYGLECQGVASCLINWPDFEPLEIKMQKTLKLSIHERPIMLVAVGYEDKTAMVPRSTKKQLGGIRRYNFE